MPVKCNTAFAFYVREKHYVYPPTVSVNLVTNINYIRNEAFCMYCNNKVGDLVENKVVFRSYCTSYNYHKKILRRCSKGKRHENHRHQYQIFIDRMGKNHPRGKVPGAQICSAKEDQPLCRTRTPVWTNLSLKNYTINDDENLYVAGVIHAPCIVPVINCYWRSIE